MKLERITKSMVDFDGNSDTQTKMAADPKYRTIEGLRTHPLYLMLRGGQRKFLEEYIANGGDRIAAIRASNNPGSDEAATVMAARHITNWRIQHLLAEFNGNAPLKHEAPLQPKEMEALIARRLRSGQLSDDAFISLTNLLLKLREQAHKLSKAKPVEPPSRPDTAQEDAKVEPEPTKPPTSQEYFERIRKMEEEQNER